MLSSASPITLAAPWGQNQACLLGSPFLGVELVFSFEYPLSNEYEMPGVELIVLNAYEISSI